MRLIAFLFVVFLIGSPTAEAMATTTPLLAIDRDSIPKIKYSGYRLYLTHFEKVKEKKGQLFIKLSVINTGNKTMQLGKGAAQIFPVAKFDSSLETADLSAYQTAIYFQLLDKKLSVPIGAISTNIELKISAEDIDKHLENINRTKAEEPIVEVAPTDVAKTAIEVEEPKEKWVVVDKKEVLTSTPIEEVPKNLPEENKKDILIASNASLQSTEITTKELEKETAVVLTENTIASSEKPFEASTEVNTSDPLPSENKNSKEKELEEKELTVAEIIAKSAAEGCSDLVIKDLNILKKNKKSVTLKYELYNQGAGTAHLVLGEKSDQESMAFRTYLSSSERLTRGSIPIESTFLHGEQVSIGQGESYTGEVKLSLLKFSKFTPVLIFELDAYEFVPECDETNNKSFIYLQGKVE